MAEPSPPAPLAFPDTGTPYSARSGPITHSGHGAPGDVQSQAQWTGPAGFGNGTCTGGSFGSPSFADADGDGIPNGQDADWTPPLDGTGYAYARCGA